MKNVSLILNAVLVIAVAILFYQVHGLKSGINQDSISTEKTIITSNTTLADTKIAYINTDSINEHYAYIADFTKVLRAKKNNPAQRISSSSFLQINRGQQQGPSSFHRRRYVATSKNHSQGECREYVRRQEFWSRVQCAKQSSPPSLCRYP